LPLLGTLRGMPSSMALCMGSCFLLLRCFGLDLPCFGSSWARKGLFGSVSLLGRAQLRQGCWRDVVGPVLERRLRCWLLLSMTKQPQTHVIQNICMYLFFFLVLSKPGSLLELYAGDVSSWDLGGTRWFGCCSPAGRAGGGCLGGPGAAA